MQPNPVALLDETLRLSASVQIVPRDLIIPPQVEDDQLPALANRVLAVRGFSKWALGAVLNQMVVRRPITHAGVATGEHDSEWAFAYAEAAGLDPKERRAVMGVYAFFPPKLRTFELSWEHYCECMWGVSDGRPNALARALAFLQVASRESLSITALRKHIRGAQITEQADETQVEAALLNYGAVFEFERFAGRELDHMETYTAERAAAVLADLSKTVSFLARLRALADSVAT